jgi:hypothetical protein
VAEPFNLVQHLFHLTFNIGVFLLPDSEIAHHADERSAHRADDGGSAAAPWRRFAARQCIKERLDRGVFELRHQAISFASA